jgi:hypothetical protein
MERCRRRNVESGAATAKGTKMNGLNNKIIAATRTARGGGAVPLMVPHGGADASSAFESAFEMLQGDDRTHELWHREPVKIPFARVR